MNTSRPRLPYHRSLATLVTLAFLSAFPALGAEPKVGEAFPSLADAQLEGTLPELKGKVVLVDFWASWCGPCRAAFPALKEIAAKYKDQVVVVGVSLDEDKEDMDGFVRKMTPNFPIVRDPKGKLAEKLDVQSIPATFILDTQGRVAAVHSGYGGDKTKKEYIEMIEKLIAAR
ncbi:MAG: TlpA family protein disulfide reductase [Verrucomicrobia bacterium]|nr:TlpA family protein disulfide reductase [Verrucomicrobiota bacterium]